MSRAAVAIALLSTLLLAVPAPSRAQSVVFLRSAVGFGTLTRDDPGRRSTDLLIVEGTANVLAGPVLLGLGALGGWYDSLTPLQPARQVSYRSFFAEARRDFGIGESPYVVDVAARLGYGVADESDRADEGVMYGGSVSIGRRLGERVVLALGGLGTWSELGGSIGRSRLWSIRLEVQFGL